MPTPSNQMPKVHKAARVAKTTASTFTQSLRAAHAIACEEEPILAMLLLDMIDRAARIEARLTEITVLHDEARQKR